MSQLVISIISKGGVNVILRRLQLLSNKMGSRLEFS